jgi:hypothetical protein
MWPLNGDMISSMEIGIKESNVYHLIGNPILALVHTTMNPCELWQRRLDHLNYCSLLSLPKMVTDIPSINLIHDSVCKGCAPRKNVKKPYSSSSRKSKGCLDLIHSDLCGPMTTPSLGDYLYYVIYIDDHSRKTWICFMKTKSETFSKF